MAKITALDEALALTGDEHLPIVQRGDTKRTTMSQFRELITPFFQNYYKGDRGNTGTSNNTRLTIQDVQAAPTTDGTSLYRGTVWTWTPGDFSATPAAQMNVSIIKANDIALTNGAWVCPDLSQSLFRAKGVGSWSRPAAEVLDLTVNVAAFGLIGDSGYHKLSDRFSSLAEAKRVYPKATALTESIDHWAIQSAIDEAEKRAALIQRRAKVMLPGMRSRLHGSLLLPNTVELEGEGSNCSFIDNQNTPLNVPLIVNAYQGDVNMFISKLSLHGGTHAIKIDSGPEGQVGRAIFDRVSCQIQSDKCIEVNRLLQLADFTNCVFGLSPCGVWVDSFTANAINFYNCGWESIAHVALRLFGAECVGIFGGRFEAGGEKALMAFTGRIDGTVLEVTSVFNGPIRPGGLLRADNGAGTSGQQLLPGTSIVRQIDGVKGQEGRYEVSHAQSIASRPMLVYPVALDLTSAACVNLRNVYIENTAQDWLRDFMSRDGVSLDACHFTQGLAPGGFPAPYRTWSDGVVHFGSLNQSAHPLIMPDAALITGQSPRLIGNATVYRSRAPGAVSFRSRHVEVTGQAQIAAVKFHRKGSSLDSMTGGALTLYVLGFDNRTGEVIRFKQRFNAIVYPNAGVLTLEKDSEQATGSPKTAVSDIIAEADATANDIVVNFSIFGLNESKPSRIWWDFEESGMSISADECLTVTCG